MLTILIALALAVVVAGVFTTVFTRTLLPFNRLTWDFRLLSPAQVENRRLLKRVAEIWYGGFVPWYRARNFRLTVSRWMRVSRWFVAAYAIGYFGAMGIHAAVLLVLR